MILETQNERKGVGMEIKIQLDGLNNILEQDFAGHGMPGVLKERNGAKE
jgi:hypothetical protein